MTLVEENIISAVVHLDEGTPLLRLMFVPVVHTKDIETKYKRQLDDLEYENSRLNKIIDKFNTNIKTLMKWLCNNFSYPWEDDPIRDFNKETYSNIDFEKELNINQFEQNYEEEIDFDIY